MARITNKKEYDKVLQEIDKHFTKEDLIRNIIHFRKEDKLCRVIVFRWEEK